MVQEIVYLETYCQMLGLPKADREDENHWEKGTKILGVLRYLTEGDRQNSCVSCSGRYVTDRPAADRALL
jgi:hypothetical protein